MSLETWFGFLAASLILLVIPGPTITLVIAYALGQGRRAASAVVAGVALGDFTALTLSLLGLGALLAASSTLFTLLKWAGAAYLVYLGIRLWRADPAPAALAERANASSTGAVLLHAYAVTALNPKSIVFFVAFVPQFIDPAAAYLPQAAILVASFVTLAAVNALLYALLAASARTRIADPRTLRLVNRAGASVLVGAAVAAATMHRS